MKLSIVTTLYNSAPYLREFYARIIKAAATLTDDFEIIFVDDGSPDQSLTIAKKLYEVDNKIKIIELSRNFGHHKAISTGLRFASGNYIFLIDCDLEEAPELLIEFWNELEEDDGLDVVYGVQQQRKGGFLERWSGYLYYTLLNKLSDIKIIRNISTIRLMKHDYAKAIIQFKEHNFYFGPVSILAGYHQKAYYFKKNNKKSSSYTFFKKYHIFLDSILSFSAKPLYFIFYFGSCITFCAFSYMIYLIIRKIAWGVAIEGWTSLIVLVALFGGFNIFFMGLLSVYVLHIFQETKNRPFAIIRRIYQARPTLVSKENDILLESINHD